MYLYIVELILVLLKNDDTRKNLFIWMYNRYEKKMKVTNKNEKNYVAVI